MRMSHVRMQELDDDGEPVGEPFDATLRWKEDSLLLSSRELPVVHLREANLVLPLTRSAAELVMGRDPGLEIITNDDGAVVGWRLR